MASIEYNLPALIKMKEKALFGYERPGVEIVRGASGDSRVRTWSDHELLSYEISPEYLPAEGDGLRDLKAFLQHIGTNGPFWLKEPITGDHLDMICGPLGDNARKCFPFPIYGTPTSALAFIGGVLQITGYTLHDAANILAADKYASPESDTDFSAFYGSDTIENNFGLTGPSCIKMTPDGLGTPCYALPASAGYAAGAPSTEYTMVVAVYEIKSAARTFTPFIMWYDSGKSLLSSAAGTPSAAVYGEWMIYTHTATSPASTAYVGLRIQEPNASVDPWFYDALSVAPASYDRWHLPSMAPGVIEFSSAPAVGERVTGSASGTKISRVRSLSPKNSWAVSKPGHAAVTGLRIVEALELE